MRDSSRPTDATRGLVVALDGPGSSGKSSVGAAAATELGYRFVDTGLLYRALTWLALERGIPEDDVARLVELVPEVELVPDEKGRLAHVSVAGTDVTSHVRGGEVDTRVSAISRVRELRAALLQRQREIAAAGRIIVAGRDIGTVVLPDADLKIFLNASAEERARRRANERGIDPDGPEGQAILTELRRRDELDTTRAVAPLRAADDAHVLVTDGNRFEDTVRLVVGEIRRAETTGTAGRAPRTRRSSDEADAAGGGSRLAAPPVAQAVPAAAPPPPIASHVAPWMHATAWVTRALTLALTRVRVEGNPDEIPRSGPVIIASNHASNLDPMVIGAWLTPRLGRRLHWLGKQELFDWPIFGWMARNGGIHPVDRSTADLDAFRLAKRILDEGHILMVFPEGTRSADGSLQPAKDGVAMLALRTGATIVPIAVAGSHRVWPKGRRLPHPGGRTVLRIGPPFHLGEDVGPNGRSRRAATAAATTRLMKQIARLLPARQRGIYSEATNPEPSKVETGAVRV